MNRAGQLERWLAHLLQYGSWFALAAIGAGFVLALIVPVDGSAFRMGHVPLLSNMRIATIGIAALILLPVLRVLLMFLVFLRDRDFRFASVAVLVLAIIILATLSGTSCNLGHNVSQGLKN